jgi:hypothetical protein
LSGYRPERFAYGGIRAAKINLLFFPPDAHAVIAADSIVSV